MRITFLSLLLVLSCCTTVRAQVDLGQPVSNTPYDSYLGPVRRTYLTLPGGPCSIDEARANLRTAKRFRYYFDKATPYTPQMPDITEAKREGDCKAKTLWLISKMGDRRGRYVIGKTTPRSPIAHAWLLWPSSGTWYILDPTNESEMYTADRVVGRKWFMRYSYIGSTAYRHPTYSQYVPQ
jgi:hypothetical protein